MDKMEMRAQFKANLNALDTPKRAWLMQQLTKVVTSRVEWQAAQTVAISIAQGDELPTALLIQIALQQGKQVVVPKVAPQKQMNFHKIDENTQYTKSSFGLLEPLDAPIIAPEQIDFFLVPALGFDENKHRLGFGGGYYDRYLPQTNGYKLGATITQNFVTPASWPTEPTDIKMDEVLILD